MTFRGDRPGAMSYLQMVSEEESRMTIIRETEDDGYDELLNGSCMNPCCSLFDLDASMLNHVMASFPRPNAQCTDARRMSSNDDDDDNCS